MSISVAQLVGYLKNKLENDPNLQGLLVTGEISNFHRQMGSGHLYFTLKDERAQISCVMFKGSALSLRFEPKNGDKVELNARASIFEASGQMQLYVSSMRLSGLGDLFQKYEELKRKLNAEGYFSEQHKKTLKSKYLSRVAVLVGDNSAAMSDIKTCFKRRWPLCTVDYYTVLVQGEMASEDIIRKLKEVDELDYEAIILARGGGSFEDLFCFNDENLVKTIYSLKTFIVSGVGHEQDFTLCDFVADLRAPTPTASVELITVNIADIKKQVNELTNANCFINPRSIFERKQMVLDYYSSRLLNYRTRLNEIAASLERFRTRMSMLMKDRIVSIQLVLKNSEQRMYNSSKMLIKRNENIVESDTLRINHSMQIKYNEYRSTLTKYAELLSAYSKENVLKRGYTLIRQNCHYVKNMSELKDKDIEVVFADGTVNAQVKE